MDIEQTPFVPSLIKACKKADKAELEQLTKSILESGISERELNYADKNGRTAVSFICATSEKWFLNFLLDLPGINVNIADNDGNTPLHFAAESGQSDSITLLTSRGPNLVIDAKNIFGITPLMKAAIQGRVDCAKRLMLANASPFEKDPARGLVTREWAKLCGRTFFANAFGELLKKGKIAQQIAMHSVPNTSSASRRDAGLASRLLHYWSFYRSKLVPESDSAQKLIVKTEATNPIPTIIITPPTPPNEEIKKTEDTNPIPNIIITPPTPPNEEITKTEGTNPIPTIIITPPTPPIEDIVKTEEWNPLPMIKVEPFDQ